MHMNINKAYHHTKVCIQMVMIS